MLLALALLGRAPTAAAQHHRHHAGRVGDEARRRFRHAVALVDEGAFAPALSEFERVWELTRNPAVLFNIAATWEAMGAFAEALDALERFEAQSPESLRAARSAEIAEARARLTARTGTLRVSVPHEGLAVAVDGIEQPRERARAGLRVTAGPHRVALSAPGYHARETLVHVVGEHESELRDPLDPQGSTLHVRCDVEGAEVRVDGAVVATTPVASGIVVTEGHHRVEVSRLGYTPVVTEVVARGLGASVEVSLPWDAHPDLTRAALLVVRVNEPGALASLDGRRVPLHGSLPLPPGPHTLRVTREHFLSETRTVTLPAGQTTEVDVQLSPTPAWRAEYVASVRATRRIGWSLALAGSAFVLAGASVGAAWFAQDADAAARFNAARAQLATPGAAGCGGDECLGPLQTYAATSSPPDATLHIAVGAGFGVLGLASLVAGVWVLASADDGRRYDRAPRASLTPTRASLTWSF